MANRLCHGDSVSQQAARFTDVLLVLELQDCNIARGLWPINMSLGMECLPKEPDIGKGCAHHKAVSIRVALSPSGCASSTNSTVILLLCSNPSPAAVANAYAHQTAG